LVDSADSVSKLKSFIQKPGIVPGFCVYHFRGICDKI